MGDMGDYWKDIKEYNKQRREGNLFAFRAFIADPANAEFAAKLVKKTEYHYHITLPEHGLINYYPSGNKWHYKDNKLRTGDPQSFANFIKNRS